MNPILWRHNSSSNSELPYHRFKEYIIRSENLDLDLSDIDFHKWTVENSALFWPYVWQLCGIKGSLNPEVFTKGDSLIEDKWFVGSTLNFTENILKFNGTSTAIYGVNEQREQTEVSWNELQWYVSQVRHYLRDNHITKGDVVAGYLPNIWQTVVCMLAVAAEGAVWTSSSPDFGVDAVVDRIGQLDPKLLITVDGYWYNNKRINIGEKVSKILTQLELDTCLTIPYLNPNAFKEWDSILESKNHLLDSYEQFDFNHPLYIMFSSGTTGKPKCIVHGAGGTLIQHLKEHQLHLAMQPQDKLMYYTTCGWMMWNWMASALASGVAIVVYDGAPFAHQESCFLDISSSIGVSHLGVSPAFLSELQKRGVDRSTLPDLTNLKAIISTGAPLMEIHYDYVYSKLGLNVCLASISGGTDIISCFVLGGYHLPVYRGEIQMAGLGMDVAVYNEHGYDVMEEKGELVCKNSFPSMPIYFWKDSSNKKYKKAYFEGFANVWTHGDYATQYHRGTFQILGRSDATLNINGIRIGTAEIYRQLDAIQEVDEAIVVTKFGNQDEMVLFLKMRENRPLTDPITQRIRNRLKENMSPRHVPRRIIEVEDLPRTISGKKMEKAVQELINGRDVLNSSACANPNSLMIFKSLKLE